LSISADFRLQLANLSPRLPIHLLDLYGRRIIAAVPDRLDPLLPCNVALMSLANQAAIIAG
jgi:hypothetical protein